MIPRDVVELANEMDAMRAKADDMGRSLATVVIVGDATLEPHPALQPVIQNKIALAPWNCHYEERPIIYCINMSNHRNKWVDLLHQRTLDRLTSLEPDVILLALGEARLAYKARVNANEAVDDYIKNMEEVVEKLKDILPATVQHHMHRKPRILVTLPKQG